MTTSGVWIAIGVSGPAVSVVGTDDLFSAFWQFVNSNWALTGFALGLVFFLGTMAFITVKYVRIMLNVLRDTPPPMLPHAARIAPKIHGETVDFRAFDGVGLRGQWLLAPAGTPRRGCIVFCHEFGMNRHSVALYAESLVAAGYDLFAFDFRNHGESALDKSYESRQWCEEREVADALGAFGYVTATLEEQGYPAEFGVFGISRGACAAILAGVQAPQIKALVCDGAFSTDRLWEHYARRWAYIFARVRFVYENHPQHIWKYLRWWLERITPHTLNCHYPSLRKAIRRTHPWRPTFFIHGQLDSYVPLDLAQELYDSAPEVKYQWIVSRARHNQAVVMEPQEYHRRIQSFFDRHLAGMEETIRLENRQNVQPVALATGA